MICHYQYMSDAASDERGAAAPVRTLTAPGYQGAITRNSTLRGASHCVVLNPFSTLIK
jgi:hypothetical protein